MNLYLPADDPRADDRIVALKNARTEYVWDRDTLAPIPVCTDVPKAEDFTSKFNTGFISRVGELALNLAAASVGDLFDPWDNLDDYGQLYPLLPDPRSATSPLSDRSFAEQRVAGVNPMSLRKLKSAEDLPTEMKTVLTQNDGALYKTVSGSTTATLASDIHDANAYFVDFSGLATVPEGRWEKGPKFLPAPVALFAWRDTGFRDRGELVPVAIWTKARDGAPARVLTPRDAPADWLRARFHLQCADANFHEMSVHLLSTHLLMEMFAVATARTLAENHPVRALLRPHLRFVIARGEEARNRLINPDGFVDHLLGGTLEGSLAIVRTAWAKFNFGEAALEADLKARGVDSTTDLPHYPYRDDARLLWTAISNHVTRYLTIWYGAPGPAANELIAKDPEIEGWALELTDPIIGAGIQGLTTDQKVDTFAKLHAVLTQVIFTLGPQHSAVNYPQWDELGYAANGPLALYGDPFQASATAMSYLPPRKQTIRQIEVMWGLASYRFDRLGDDALDSDPRVQAVVNLFRAELRDIVEVEIRRRNTKRPTPYEYLLPSKVTNGIAV